MRKATIRKFNLIRKSFSDYSMTVVFDNDNDIDNTVLIVFFDSIL